MSNKKYEAVTEVDEYGCIRPSFKLGLDAYSITSGFLKYFHAFKGKKVKVTIEVLDGELTCDYENSKY